MNRKKAIKRVKIYHDKEHEYDKDNHHQPPHHSHSHGPLHVYKRNENNSHSGHDHTKIDLDALRRQETNHANMGKSKMQIMMANPIAAGLKKFFL